MHVVGMRVIQSPQTWPKQTLLVKSKTRGTTVLHMMFEDQRDRVMALVQCTSIALEIGRPRLNQQSQSILYTSAEIIDCIAP
jgi:hypothetical protein